MWKLKRFIADELLYLAYLEVSEKIDGFPSLLKHFQQDTFRARILTCLKIPKKIMPTGRGHYPFLLDTKIYRPN